MESDTGRKNLEIISKDLTESIATQGGRTKVDSANTTLGTIETHQVRARANEWMRPLKSNESTKNQISGDISIRYIVCP